jgi:Zn finger protein HypA/HybF involved in hydrogenase expression
MNYTYNDVLCAVNESKSIANTLRLIGLKPKGANYKTIKKYFIDNDIDTSHFTGSAHNVGDDFKMVKEKIPLKYYLVENIKTSSHRLKRRLIEEGVKQHKCEKCTLDKWLNKKIPLELHHIDGDHYNNRIDNLELLCPNCHGLTPNYRANHKNKNNVNPKLISELHPEFFIKTKIKDSNKKCKCGTKISVNAELCPKCNWIKNRKVDRPSTEELHKDIDELGYKGTGRKYGVSDNAIRKWVK